MQYRERKENMPRWGGVEVPDVDFFRVVSVGGSLRKVV